MKLFIEIFQSTTSVVGIFFMIFALIGMIISLIDAKRWFYNKFFDLIRQARPVESQPIKMKVHYLKHRRVKNP